MLLDINRRPGIKGSFCFSYLHYYKAQENKRGGTRWMMTTSVFTRPLTNTSEVNKNPIIHIVHNYTVRENVLKHVEAVNSFKYED